METCRLKKGNLKILNAEDVRETCIMRNILEEVEENMFIVSSIKGRHNFKTGICLYNIDGTYEKISRLHSCYSENFNFTQIEKFKTRPTMLIIDCDFFTS